MEKRVAVGVLGGGEGRVGGDMGEDCGGVFGDEVEEDIDSAAGGCHGNSGIMRLRLYARCA